MNDRFTSAQVVKFTGITPRQLQWWDERGIVQPLREGRCRMYSFDDLTEVAVICALRRKGFPLQRVLDWRSLQLRAEEENAGGIVDPKQNQHDRSRCTETGGR